MTTAGNGAPAAMKDGRGYALLVAADGKPAEDGSPAAGGGPPTAPTLYLYDVLGVDLFGGIAAHQVIDDLAALGAVPALDVRINSPGGDVFEGIAVYNALVRFPGKLTVHVDGVAASIASLVALAGDETLVAENAMLMVHRPWTAVVGDAEDMRQQAGVLDKAWSAMLATYARSTGRRAEKLAQRVADAGGEWWLTAAEAVAEGFADKVEKPKKDAAVFGLARFKHVPERLAASATNAGLPTAERPCVAEIAAPRVARTSSAESAAAARRRTVEVLRLAT